MPKRNDPPSSFFKSHHASSTKRILFFKLVLHVADRKNNQTVIYLNGCLLVQKSRPRSGRVFFETDRELFPADGTRKDEFKVGECRRRDLRKIGVGRYVF